MACSQEPGQGPEPTTPWLCHCTSAAPGLWVDLAARTGTFTHESTFEARLGRTLPMYQLCVLLNCWEGARPCPQAHLYSCCSAIQVGVHWAQAQSGYSWPTSELSSAARLSTLCRVLGPQNSGSCSSSMGLPDQDLTSCNFQTGIREIRCLFLVYMCMDAKDPFDMPEDDRRSMLVSRSCCISLQLAEEYRNVASPGGYLRLSAKSTLHTATPQHPTPR